MNADPDLTEPEWHRGCSWCWRTNWHGASDDHRCEAVLDEDGAVIAHALVSPDLGERGRQALAEVVKAAVRLVEERDAADPESAAERARRQEAGRARIAERMRRYRGEGE